MVRRTQMKRASRAVRVGQTPYGRGVFARRRFASGDVIAEIRGQVIDDPDYGSDYCIDLGTGEVLEPDAPLRFLNHSCQPNCEVTGRTTWDDEKGALQHATWLKALTAIVVGEQLTIDYAWPSTAAIPCLCGSPGCRGWIVDPEQLEELLQAHPITS